jgi:FlaA1/EpsC-like NDP-sugar epimerase
MITGGVGSFSNAVLKRFLNLDIAEIRIFSRDEKSKATCIDVTPVPSKNSTLVISVIINVY